MAVAAVLEAAPEVDIVVPVYNEERDLAASVRRLNAFLDRRLPFSARITIADNASTDETWAVASKLAAELPRVRLLHLNEKGRGRALAAAWLTSDAEVVAYTDVDLSTDLKALLPLLAPIISGHSDLAIGSRLARGARVRRGPRRELISRAYNLILRLVLGVGFRDAQCGFKALRAPVARRLLPEIVNRNWFFDTELLVLAERSGLRIHEVPVDWVDDPDSRVDVVATSLEDLRGIWRLATSRPAGAPGLRRQVARFLAVGAASTVAYGILYWVLRGLLPAVAANALALLATALANTAANRRLTFGIRGSDGLLRDHLGGLAAFLVALGLTSGVIAVLSGFAQQAPRLLEVGLLTLANAAATIVRFLILRALLFHLRSHSWRKAT